MTPRPFVEKWTYQTFFSGLQTIYVPVGASRESIISTIDAGHHRDNWRKNSLKKVGRVKAPRGLSQN